MAIKLGDFTDPQVQNLLHLHMSGMLSNTPKEHSFALDLSGLQKPNISFYTLWD